MNLELIRIFVKVIQKESFSRAAEILRIPKSTVSKAISRLEHEAKTKLILRTTRSLKPTLAGQVFYEASLLPIIHLEQAEESLYNKDSILSGHVKITTLEGIGSFVITPVIANLSSKHPGLSFEFEYTHKIIDLVKDGVDLAIRLGELPDSNLKIKKAGDLILIPVASPTYMQGKKAIKVPNDLQHHACISASVLRMEQRWILRSESESIVIPINSKICCNEMSCLLQLVLSGAGVGLASGFMCEQHIKAGRLVRVLPEWSPPGIPVSILSPFTPSSCARLKLVIDYLYKALYKALHTK